MKRYCAWPTSLWIPKYTIHTKGLNQRAWHLPLLLDEIFGSLTNTLDDGRASGIFEGRPSTRKMTLASGIKRKCLNSGANERLCEIDRANRRRSVTEQSVGIKAAPEMPPYITKDYSEFTRFTLYYNPKWLGRINEFSYGCIRRDTAQTAPRTRPDRIPPGTILFHLFNVTFYFYLSQNR